MVAEQKWGDESLAKIKIPEELPLLSLKNSVVFPYLATPLVVGRKNSLEAVKSASKEHKIIVVVAQREEDKEIVEKEDLYEIGTACAIKQVVNVNDNEIETRFFSICPARSRRGPWLFRSVCRCGFCK